MIIYKITNNVNGQVYIGQTCNFKKRFCAHKSAKSMTSYLHAAIRKYGWDIFKMEIICETDELSADDLERKYISEYNSFNKCFSQDRNIPNYKQNKRLYVKHTQKRILRIENKTPYFVDSL